MIKSALFFSGIWSLVISYGEWTGQLSAVPTPSHGVFLVCYALIYIFIITVSLESFTLNFKYWKFISVLFCNLLIISFFRDDYIASFRNFIAILMTYCIILILAKIFHSMALERAIKLLIWTLLSIIVVTIYIHITYDGPLILFPDRADDNIYRLGGLLYYAHTAMLCGLICVLCFWVLLNKVSRNPLIYGTILIFAFISLLFTDVRSVWLATVISFFVVLIYSSYEFNIKRNLTYGVIIFSPIMYLMYMYFYSSKTSSGSEVGNDLSIRSMIWALSIDGILAAPFTGYGSESFLKSSSAAFSFNQDLTDPHSSFLSLCLQSGMLSVVLFLVLYCKITIDFFKYANKQYKCMIFIPLFWFIAPFFWSYVYNGTAGLIQTIFPLTMIAILCHPDVYKISINE